MVACTRSGRRDRRAMSSFASELKGHRAIVDEWIERADSAHAEWQAARTSTKKCRDPLNIVLPVKFCSDRGMVDRARLASLDARVATLGARASHAKASLASVRLHRDEAQGRVNQPVDERVARIVAPMEASLEVIDARLRALQERRERLVALEVFDGGARDAVETFDQLRLHLVEARNVDVTHLL